MARDLDAADGRLSRAGETARGLALALPGAGVLAAVFAVPVLLLAVYSVLTGGVYAYGAEPPLTTENFSKLLSAESTASLALNAAVIGAATGAVTILVALPTAYWMRFCASRSRVPLLVFVVLCLFTSYLVRIYAWRTLLGEQGIINEALRGTGLTDEPLGFLLFSRFAIVTALVHLILPVAILVLYAGFQPLEPRYLQTAEDLGSSPLDRWRRVVLPVMAGPIASAFMLVFVLASADYVTPQLLGGPGDLPLGVQVQTALRQLGDYAQAAAIGVVVLVGYALVLLVLRLLLRARRLHRIDWPTL